MAKRSILTNRFIKKPEIEKNDSKHYDGVTKFTYPTTAAPVLTPNPSLKDNWPGDLKGIEFLLKYPTTQEDSGIPVDLQDTVSEEGDPSETMPDKKDTDLSDITTIPDKKDTYTVEMSTIPGKSAKKDYDYPSISIEGEDGKLAKLFKSIPKD